MSQRQVDTPAATTTATARTITATARREGRRTRGEGAPTEEGTEGATEEGASNYNGQEQDEEGGTASSTVPAALVDAEEDCASINQHNTIEAVVAPPPTTMIEYFQSISCTSTTGGDMISSSSSADRQEALAIILDRINHDVSTQGETTGISAGPADLFSRSKSKIRKEILDLISGRIPPEKRLARFGEASLKKWLTSTNTYRSYMFFSKQAMIDIAASRGGIRLTTALSVDKMVAKLVEIIPPPPSSAERGHQEGGQSGQVATGQEEVGGEGTEQHGRRVLAGASLQDNNRPQQHNQRRETRTTSTSTELDDENEDVMTISKEIVKSILKKSFMKPLKGQARDYCRMGHKLELPIGLDWMKDVNEKKLLPGFKIISLHKVGLVGKKNHPWAKDSIDFIAFVYDEDSSSVELWGVEVKSRQTNSTISEEKEHTRKLRRGKYKHVDANLAHKFVRKPDERFQLLHHSHVYGFDRVALIVANNSAKVITGTVIEFNNTLHEKYGKVLERLKNIALPWAYSDIDTALIVIPNDVITLSKQMPAINGKETLYGALKLWRKMFSDPSILPRPVIKRIIPTTHAQWNATKGGSDTVTKLVDDCFVSPPKVYTNFESVAFTRCISNIIASILKLYQTITSKDDLSTAYSTIQHYRNAASHRITSKDF